MAEVSLSLDYPFTINWALAVISSGYSRCSSNLIALLIEAIPGLSK
jgi:hypothetical protein